MHLGPQPPSSAPRSQPPSQPQFHLVQVAPRQSSTPFPPPTPELQEEWNRIGLATAEADAHRLQRYLAAMNRDTEKRKQDEQIQRLVFQHAILYLQNSNAWLACPCTFCVLMRYIRQYEGFDQIGQRVWEDEDYMRCRNFLESSDIEVCGCGFCRGLVSSYREGEDGRKENLNGFNFIDRENCHGKLKEIEGDETLANSSRDFNFCGKGDHVILKPDKENGRFSGVFDPNKTWPFDPNYQFIKFGDSDSFVTPIIRIESRHSHMFQLKGYNKDIDWQIKNLFTAN
ncbi:hypothetical protein TWF694_004380 [Orbilia ellipsospora]|uniref:Uncharacterized protein n=1 Tax=Orbilia ellipsospora TaxID=2528407 RepID=A0AAV9WY84_9PEZI